MPCLSALGDLGPARRRREGLGLALSGLAWAAVYTWRSGGSFAEPHWTPLGGLATIAGLGACLPGLLGLWLAKRSEEESPPPRWMLAWLLAGVVSLFFHGLERGGAGAAWIPLAAIGMADWITRQHSDERAIRVGALSLALQLMLTGAAVAPWERHLELDLPWIERAHEALERGDLVVSQGARATFLLRHRFGLEVLAPRAGEEPAAFARRIEGAVESARASGRSVWYLPEGRGEAKRSPSPGLRELQLRRLD